MVFFAGVLRFKWTKDEFDSKAADAADARAEGEAQSAGYDEGGYRYCVICERKLSSLSVSMERHRLEISAIVLAGAIIPSWPPHSL